MNFRDILTNILVTANYPEQKRTQFINTFYEYLFVKLLNVLQVSDPITYHKLLEALEGAENSVDRINQSLQEAYKVPELKEKIDKVIEEVLGELAGDIVSSATEEQKAKILISFG